MTFADALKIAMGDETQIALSARCGIDQASISRYLAGTREPNMRQLNALERALPALRDLRSAVA